jgi:hypothetical protein
MGSTPSLERSLLNHIDQLWYTQTLSLLLISFETLNLWGYIAQNQNSFRYLVWVLGFLGIKTVNMPLRKTTSIRDSCIR